MAGGLVCAGLAFGFSMTSTAVAANPMWTTGLEWSCAYSQVVACERLQACKANSELSTITIHYPDNQVVSVGATIVKIKRHYVQTIAGSPIGVEVKIELINNETLWLYPADASGAFSKNWLGVLVTPRGGVVIAEMRPLICRQT